MAVTGQWELPDESGRRRDIVSVYAYMCVCVCACMRASKHVCCRNVVCQMEAYMSTIELSFLKLLYNQCGAEHAGPSLGHKLMKQT